MKYRANFTINFDHAFDADSDKEALIKVLELTTMPTAAVAAAEGEPRCGWNTVTRLDTDTPKRGGSDDE